jgi:hypothetical protein
VRPLEVCQERDHAGKNCHDLGDASFMLFSQSQSISTISKYSSLKATNTMPIKKNQDVAEKGGKKNQPMNQKEDKPSKESSAAGKNEKKQAQKPG